ncbi:MAG: sodium-dependent transporter [Pseudomonadota bacterium]
MVQATATTSESGGETWSNRAAFMLAAIGSSVGLGNLWRFPFEAGQNGGGAFVLLYIVCVALIGLPVLVTELFVGRRGRKSAVGSVVVIARAEGQSIWWSLQSWIGMLGAFIILTFYSVIAGWVIAYVVALFGNLISQVIANGPSAFLAGAFAGETSEEVTARFVALLNDPMRMIAYHAVFMIVTVSIVARGVKKGIEGTVKVLMPAFFVMLIVLLVFSLLQGDFGRAANFLFGIRLSDLFTGIADGSVINAALGQAFFSIGLGSALMSTYGAYMAKDTDVPGSARVIAIADTSVGIIAGLAIFPIVFAAGLDPAGGPALMFLTLPLAFQTMPFGAVFGLIFFCLGFFAALTSSIALLETSTKWVDEQSSGNHRVASAMALGTAAFVIGIANALSQVPAGGGDGGATRDLFWNTFYPGGEFPLFLSNGAPMVLLDFLNELTNIILPVSGFIAAIFAGWVVSTSTAREAIGFQSDRWFNRWRFLVRYVCPIGIGAVIVYSAIIAPFFLS